MTNNRKSQITLQEKSRNATQRNRMKSKSLRLDEQISLTERAKDRNKFQRLEN